MKPFRKLYYLIYYFGVIWLFKRFLYALKIKTGDLARKSPVVEWESVKQSDYLSPGISESELYDRLTSSDRFFFRSENFNRWHMFFKNFDSASVRSPIAESESLFNGSFQYFSQRSFNVGFPPNWFLNPYERSTYPSSPHWSRIDDFQYGDIKGVWELNRFGFVYALVRSYARNFDNRYPAAFWRLVEDWYDKNPPNHGPNWKCGQEIAFRSMAFCFGLFAFLKNHETTPERISTLARMLAVSGNRIQANLSYAVNQKNNHGISEATGLLTLGMLFPEFRRSKRWANLGRRLLEKQALELIDEDGSFCQHSVIYHRLMLHDYLWCIQLTEKNGNPLSKRLKERIQKASDFLFQIQDQVGGETPKYGQNDGSLVLPLSNCDYHDFRPVIQTAYRVLAGENAYELGPWAEESLWLTGRTPVDEKKHPGKKDNYHAEAGGYFVFRSENSFIFTRCGSFRHRPGQADMLHVDLWWKGLNIASDSGTYSYNMPDEPDSSFSGTCYHNTVTVDKQDQMHRAGRFMWLPWIRGKVEAFCGGKSIQYWQGSHDGYEKSCHVRYQRSIIRLPNDTWLVADRLTGVKEHAFQLNWHVPLDRFDNLEKGGIVFDTAKGKYFLNIFKSTDSGWSPCAVNKEICWIAPYYLEKTKSNLFYSQAMDRSVLLVSVFSPMSFLPNGNDGFTSGDNALILIPSQGDLLIEKIELRGRINEKLYPTLS